MLVRFRLSSIYDWTPIYVCAYIFSRCEDDVKLELGEKLRLQDFPGSIATEVRSILPVLLQYLQVLHLESVWH